MIDRHFIKDMIWQFLSDSDCVADLSVWKGDNRKHLESHISIWVDDYILKCALNAQKSNRKKKRQKNHPIPGSK